MAEAGSYNIQTSPPSRYARLPLSIAWSGSWTVRSTEKLLAVLLLLMLVSGCSSLNPATETVLGTAVVQPKILATLYVSPTPNDQQRDATRLAADVVTPTLAPSRTPAPTAYVGVFLGESGAADGDILNADPARFAGTLAATFPTLGAPGCAYPVDAVFGTSWTTNSAAVSDLGCAGEPVHSYVGTEQIFEHGVMMWIPTNEIWALVPSGGIDGRYWYVEQAPPDQGWTVPPPSGLRMPEQGFGAVWKAVDGVRQALGFARTEEQSASLALQRFEKGALLRDATAGQTFILIGGDTGSTYGSY